MKIIQIEVDDCIDCALRKDDGSVTCKVPDGDKLYFILRKRGEIFPSFCPLLKGVVIVTRGGEKK